MTEMNVAVVRVVRVGRHGCVEALEPSLCTKAATADDTASAAIRGSTTPGSMLAISRDSSIGEWADGTLYRLDTGGEISQGGEFTAGEESGAFVVTAKANGIDSSVQVRVAKESETGPGPDPPKT